MVSDYICSPKLHVPTDLAWPRPDFCDGSYTSYCDDSRDYYNITCILESYGATDVLSVMQTYWKDDDGDDEVFWEHEWNKHGTCYSTLNPSCYTDYTAQEEVVDFFNTTTSLFQTLPTYQFLADAGIYPSSNETYAKTDIIAALRAARGVNATLECEDGVLYEIEYTFNVHGSVADGIFVAVEPTGEGDGCPDEIQYLPKDLDTEPTASSVTCAATAAATKL